MITPLTRWLLAVVATAFVELVTLIALALWILDDFSRITLGAGGAVALAAATIVAVYSGARPINAALRYARERRRHDDDRDVRGKLMLHAGDASTSMSRLSRHQPPYFDHPPRPRDHDLQIVLH